MAHIYKDGKIRLISDSEIGQSILAEKWDGESYRETKAINIKIDGLGNISIYINKKQYDGNEN